MRPLRWVSKSHDKLATALRAMGHKVSSSTVPKLLEELKYCCHSTARPRKAANIPIATPSSNISTPRPSVSAAISRRYRSIQEGIAWRIQERRQRLRAARPADRIDTHDFEDKELGKFVPYGIYDDGELGYVSLGIDHDTGQFAANGVRLWLDRMGRERYPSMTRLIITADGGGFNGSRLRLWKVALQQLADDRPDHPGLPLSAGDLEVEQDRAPHVPPLPRTGAACLWSASSWPSN